MLLANPEIELAEAFFLQTISLPKQPHHLLARLPSRQAGKPPDERHLEVGEPRAHLPLQVGEPCRKVLVQRVECYAWLPVGHCPSLFTHRITSGRAWECPNKVTPGVTAG